ncbi:hypothetical protein [Nesterenkonia alba]|uniref:hypothetical protein n=1 Tax=Nesterenkonia alba TaxID=515814 RepID=UPI0003B38A7D|nr:hypothetical protein [Nesterenkonia alba]
MLDFKEFAAADNPHFGQKEHKRPGTIADRSNRRENEDLAEYAQRRAARFDGEENKDS